ncbi:MAG TPA: outer membrane protein assembly factor BamD [Desulfobacterales bacterium]|nr:outer membrane protein assembly factor BamD [Desulfobacterales bacterium]
MKRVVLILMVVMSLALSGCSDNGAQELFETAELEELQNNQHHARQLYEEIIRKYPDSEYAKNAEERLSALQK